MNKVELGKKIADFIFGKKIEGTVSAVLPSRTIYSSRYVVETSEGVLDVHVSKIESHAPYSPYASATYRSQLERGNKINTRATSIRPWIDGQTIYLGS